MDEGKEGGKETREGRTVRRKERRKVEGRKGMTEGEKDG